VSARAVKFHSLSIYDESSAAACLERMHIINYTITAAFFTISLTTTSLLIATEDLKEFLRLSHNRSDLIDNKRCSKSNIDLVSI
jgi:hypothetical protein